MKGGIFTLVLVYLALLTCVQILSTRHFGLAGWSGFSMLAPVVAGALLSMRQTVIVGVVNIASVGLSYGYAIPDLEMGIRILVNIAALCSFALAVLVCRIRLDREARVRRLTIARERLTLLRVASQHIGSTLDVSRTAGEVAEVAVPRFADLVTVDLYESVLRGDEPPDPEQGRGTLRRIAQRSASGNGGGKGDGGGDARGTEEGGGGEFAAPGPATGEAHQNDAVPVRCLVEGATCRATLLDGEDVPGWLGGDARHAGSPGQPVAHSGIAVPLRARGATLGVAVFVRNRRDEPFDADDLLLAEEIGVQAAVCVDNARRYTHEHRTSLALQRSLLPRRLPRIAAVEVATRYLPADSTVGVGGDWFDVIQLSGARVALVVGDVVGHGLYATATMGRLRSAVRTLADIDLAPDELLTHLDDVVIRLGSETEESAEEQEIPGGAVGATCLYAVYDPVGRTCVMARAGHPAPVLVRPDGRAELLEAPAGPPLGLGGLPFEATELSLPEGSLLALYTNGLVDVDHDMARGQESLRQALAGRSTSLETTCDEVLGTVLEGVLPTDDIALLLARTRALDASHVATWDIADEPTAVGRARELADRQLTAWDLRDAAFATELVVSELVTNAIRHADGPLQLRLIREPSALICEVSDSSSTSPHLRRARILDESGRGLFIVANLTERWGTRHGRYGKTIWAELSPAQQQGTELASL
ncbi:GAF domain-containing protein [Streptomyces radicis]|uniref:GAF domain-containing protein n=2 Tax=Streptomyces radicis TaxID=1750517 RepID=A0A3A9W8K8_9ACTN|nr:GAF domain-containing protein [Streptomyces radicis]RKN22910.1 GAF domain-containing protein [Streptomyces radicis]